MTSKCADQPAQSASAFIIHSMQSIIYKLASCNILTFQLDYVAEKARLSVTCRKTPNTGFFFLVVETQMGTKAC